MIALTLALLTAAPEAGAVLWFDLAPWHAGDLADPAARRRIWDHAHLVSALQGLVNRDGPRLFVRGVPRADDFWWQQITAPGGWLAGRPVQRVATVDALLAACRGAYRGLVVWDERVPATSNLASSIAGAERLLPVRYDAAEGSLYRHLTSGPTALPVAVDLRAADGGPLFTGRGTLPGTTDPSSGSAKNDAYRWLIAHYLRPGRLNPRRLGYYLDGFWLTCAPAGATELHTLTNHDWLVAEGGMLFDLNVWDDEASVDDPGAPPGCDAATLQLLLRACWDQLRGQQMIHVAGFVPWAYKYTDYRGPAWSAGGRHAPVPTEWRCAELLSCFNAYLDADAIGLSAMANASFYRHYPLRERYPQPQPTTAALTAAGLLTADGRIVPRHYVAHYVGDYDAAAWLYQRLPAIWGDPARGRVPLAWAFNPNLSERFPLGLAWAREHAVANDRFVAGDSGAGYLNPGYLTPPRPFSDLPSGLAVWEAHCARHYRQWDLAVSGFVIDGYARGLDAAGLAAYARFSPGGLVGQKVGRQGLRDGLPYLRMSSDLPGEAAAAARVLAGVNAGPRPSFHVFRSILQTPTWYAAVSDQLAAAAGEAVQVIDLPALLELLRRYHLDPARHQPDRARLRETTTLVATPGAVDDLAPVPVADGPFEVQTQAGSTCWVSPPHTPPYYLYFALPDPWYDPGEGPVTVTVEYLDNSGEVGLQYDSTDPAAPLDGAYKGHPETLRRRGSGTWRSHRWTLPDPRLAGSQNNGADFRLFNSGAALAVRRVSVSRG